MARKSRKHKQKGFHFMKKYHAAAYIRNSSDNKNYPSSSIENQKTIIENYIDQQIDIELSKTYVDKNTSGQTFDRGSFEQLLNDLENGIVNCVLVKDLSRLGRNYIDVGYYLQKYFPTKNIRFISVSDNYDSLKDNIKLELLLRTVFDERVAKDFSDMQKSIHKLHAEQGNYVAPRAPYGYCKSENKKYQLEIDKESADIVEVVFEMANDGMSLSKIVRMLNKNEILTPIRYALKNGLTGNYNKGNGLWNSRSIKAILTNRVYTGDLEHRQLHIITKNTHEAIVDHITFEHVQNILTKQGLSHNTSNKPLDDNFLKGKVLCGCCGKKLQRRRGSGKADWNFFTCISNNRYGQGYCTGMYLREHKIFDKLKQEITSFVKENESLENNLTISKHEKEIQKLENEAYVTMLESKKVFESLVAKRITEEEFKTQFVSVEPLRRAIDMLHLEISTLEKNQEKQALFTKCSSNHSLLKEILDDYIEDIVVVNMEITISWKE